MRVVVLHGDPGSGERVAIADAGTLQDLRTFERAGAQDDFAIAVDTEITPRVA
jgi:hypothetical protein